MSKIKLTQFSHGAGCGCKISPKVLDTILTTNIRNIVDPALLVGNDKRDDAAVYDLGDGTALISTTDFFMPIVDDPFTFGQIAATNAISDVYAMGGEPLVAIAILGWPINKIAPEVAREVLEGARSTCKEAGITLAGGHSIDSPEPIFGLAVSGSVKTGEIKHNDTAIPGCKLILTKPLGVGILTTAEKQGKLKSEHRGLAAESMVKLNKIGTSLAKIKAVKALTDVTGFGLLGHLVEMCQGSNVSARIYRDQVPVFDMIDQYISENCIPGGTHRNWESYGSHVRLKDPSDKFILCDPQTSGGLLIAVEEKELTSLQSLLKEHDLTSNVLGEITDKVEQLIDVI